MEPSLTSTQLSHHQSSLHSQLLTTNYSPPFQKHPYPAAPLRDVCPEEIAPALNSTALQLLQEQDAQQMDADLTRLRYEDELTVLAARRGLLTRFVVKSLRGYALSPELVVDVPEFACVGLLMRRIFRAKLQRGEFLPPARFVLRRHRLEAGQLVGMETLAPQSETGDEQFLFNLGYRAPGPHEVYMQSAPRSNDREQQQRLLGAGAGAAEGARAPYSMLPGIAPAAGSFQQLLLGTAGGAPPASAPATRWRRAEPTRWVQERE